ncbi:putative transcription factor C3H family [Helianthus annuus]|nr:putative transcription factor C3H family [Helianthus annuus]
MSPGDQTEPVWQLGLGGGSDSLPQRPDEADCIYYLRTGFCGYGSRCRFNHPVDRGGSVFGGVRSGGGGEYPERIGEPVCQYYMRTGMCKFGASCKYHHPRHGVGSSSTVLLSVSGYPLRPGEKECSYYVKTGQCKFGPTCKFHHPPAYDHNAAATTTTGTTTATRIFAFRSIPISSCLFPTIWSICKTVSSSRPVFSRALRSVATSTTSNGPISKLESLSVLIQAPASPNTIGAGPFYAIAPHLSPPVPSYTGSYLSVPSSSSKNEHSLPQRPGEPECQYYLKTGDCKFGSSCRYHHPPEWTAPSSNFVLSPMGLPVRPGAPVCTHYSQKGVCRFGPSCKFDHPMGMLSYSSSASSLAEMPVAPYPVGLSIATLAPSSSSSNLRPDLISTANKDGSSSSKNMPVSDSTGGTSTTRGHST